MKNELVRGVLIQRSEERDALDMVPVKMRNKNVGSKRLAVGPVMQSMAQSAKPRAAVENVGVGPHTHFHAGSVPAIAQVFRLRSWSRSAHSPELDSHTPPCGFSSIFYGRGENVNSIHWFAATK